MLKIKDDVDLKELEKFGFVFNDNDYYYDFKTYTETEYSYLLIIIDTRKLITDYVEYEHIDRAISVLYDLIKAGLVEKV